ncbi:3-hydroxybutyrate oligomer hydrolase family protein [Janthinobacterium sp. B9-8]|uniref:3-hydroxybutyrate oligomer hydrolase family protein n=1 Tax=Janthinobacterium sp. B9-8 TaxID=1236179 RepID=UPI00061D2274|nr:3-hydroxybutyrate oligomer hydrolase family protein [Janthinobacterium sp. B9-8]AMC34044.1 D-(-)-3-hydroxybutyrate oligomer hydrolase [Janthinobacterium sp. B9-8]
MRLLLTGMVVLLSACNSNDIFSSNTRPAWLGNVSQNNLDGVSNDLLTAGLGKSGLALALPAHADPAKPTPTELRRAAIYNNYRALVDISSSGGYGRLYGPNIDISGNDTLGEGKIAGEEYLAYADDGTGRQNVTLMVQIPASFNQSKPCVVTATSSGSRGVYGAVSAAGEWGLKHGCAVAYADKGSGTGIHDLSSDTVNLIDGTRANRSFGGGNFDAGLSGSELADFNAQFPNRIASKHAHSQQNPEKDWGRDTLRAVEFAFWLLNEKYASAQVGLRKADYATPATVTVIAASASNGGGAALAAAEQDTRGLIDGVAVSEPQVQPASVVGLSILQGGNLMPAIGSPLIDYFTLANLYQPCAVQSARLSGANSAFGTAVSPLLGSARCASLAAKGFLSGSTLEAQANEAYNKLISAGWLVESDALHASHYGLNATLGVALAYVNAYGRFSVKDNICGYSYAFTNTTGDVIAPIGNNLAGVFGSGNGVPPTSGISIVNNLSVGGAKADAMSISASTNTADYNLDGAICLRKLATGLNPLTGATLTGNEKLQADRVAIGIKEAQRNARLNGKPAIIVAGRSDALIPVNHAARAYYALNQAQEGSGSKLRYIEVTNGQHFDAFLALSGFPTRFIPLHVYAGRALDAMWAHLNNGTALPDSQVVRTTPRTSATDNLNASALPAFAAVPASDAIRFSNTTLSIAQ